jgi:hypothetical protein
MKIDTLEEHLNALGRINELMDLDPNEESEVVANELRELSLAVVEFEGKMWPIDEACLQGLNPNNE